VLVRICALFLIVIGCSNADSDHETARDAVRTTVLTAFTTALAAEGPVERVPLIVAAELDSAQSGIAAAGPALVRQFPAYDRAAFADLLSEMRTPGVVAVPASLSGKLHLVGDSVARVLADSIALTGQLILRTSPVGLNANATRAVTLLTVECGPGCGARQLVFLSGKGERWIVIERVKLVGK
jgi:hypothetical protein